jgi:RNA polymerase sigma-70 factor (ECF subfamily)
MSRPPATPESLLAHVEWVRRLAATLVSGSLEADDVAQETWRVALERPPREPEQRGQLRHWLAIVARNVARRLGAAERRHAVRLDEDVGGGGDGRVVPPDAAPSAAQMVERAQLQRRVVGAVLALDEPYRSTLLYRFFEDLAPSVIAARTSVPIDTVKTRLKRGLAQLREKLKADFGDERGGSNLALALAPLLVPRVGEALIAATAAASLPSAVAGGVIVSAKTKLVLAAAALLAGAIVWRAVESPNRRETTDATATSTPARARSSEPADAPPLAEPALVVDTSTVGAPQRRVEPRVAASKATPTTSAVDPAVVGVVHDAEGALVPGATVFLARLGRAGFTSREDFLLEHEPIGLAKAGSEAARASATDDLQVTTTDSAGRFEFATTASSTTWTLAALHPDRGVAFVLDAEVPLEGRPARFDLTLEPGVVVVGSVFSPDRLAVPGAHVELFAYPHGWTMRPDEENWGGKRVATATADAAGHWRTMPLPFESFRVVASPPRDFLPRCMTTNSAVVKVDPLEPQTQVDVTLEPLRTLNGRLIVRGRWPTLAAWEAERESRRDLAGRLPDLVLWACNHDPRYVMKVLPWPPDRGSIWVRYDSGAVDFEHDTYSIDLHTPHMRYLEVICGDVLLGWAEIPPQPPAPDVEVDLDRVPSPDAQAKRAGKLVVHVQCEGAEQVVDGHCKVGVSLFVAGADGHSSSSVSGSADHAIPRDGTLEVPDVDEGELTVTAAVPGFVSSRAVATMRDGATTTVTLRLARAARVAKGRVVRADGEPDRESEVRVYRRVGRDFELVETALARTDGDGAFEIGSLPDANLLVVAASDRLAPAWSSFDLGSAGPLTLSRPIGVSVGLSVHCDDGTGVGAVKYRVFDLAGVPVLDDFGVSGKHSNYRAADSSTVVLAPGDYTLEAWAPGFELATTRFTANTNAKVSLAVVRLPARAQR